VETSLRDCGLRSAGLRKVLKRSIIFTISCARAKAGRRFAEVDSEVIHYTARANEPQSHQYHPSNQISSERGHPVRLSAQREHSPAVEDRAE
jgi:hypothetical protein